MLRRVQDMYGMEDITRQRAGADWARQMNERARTGTNRAQGSEYKIEKRSNFSSKVDSGEVVLVVIRVEHARG